MEKTIGLYGKGSCGKSSTLYYLAKLLIADGATLLNSNKNLDFFNNTPKEMKGEYCDFRAVFLLAGQSIGITTWGDNKAEMERNLKFLKENEECNIVISASRSRGATTDLLFSLAEKHSAELIWAAKSYYADNTTNKATPAQMNAMNNLEAQFLLSLI